MLRRTALALGVAITALAAPHAEAQERQRFTFWYGLSGQLGDVVQQVCKRFNDSQRDFEVSCVSQGDYPRTLQNAIAAFRAGEQPTVVQVYDIGTADLMLSGQYVPARELMAEQKRNVDWNNYLSPIAAYYATSKGEMLSFPFNSSTAVMYWNRGAFRDVGYEKPPETWEDVEKALRALKAKGHACPMAINFDSWPWLEQFASVHNLPIASEDNGYGGLDAKLVFNDGLIRKHFNNIYRWYKEGLLVVKTPETGQIATAAFADGTCASMFNSIADHSTVRLTAKQGLDWTPAMLPLYAGTTRTNSRVGGASLWTLKGRPAAEYRGAAAFFEFLAKPESEEFWSTNTGYIPVTRAGYDKLKAEGFFQRPQNVGREVAMDSLLVTEPTQYSRGLRLGGFTQIRAIYANEMQAAFSGQKTMDQALDTMVEEGNRVLRRFEQTYRGKQLP
ncbi:extracellular solute-binding protein [Roseomonas elaeocarpi]|uniref:sn-glycerol-3-phosphate-binding periplasmic protein UgpB n=1 Tax=Roseomonas elaeocarpi TaxID=907779 RepID=A0ABV6JVT5_9PROT